MIKTIKTLMDKIDDKTLVITSTGMISRVVFSVKDRPQTFYIMGSMGASLGIGIGLALNTERQVVVISGDGDILMSLGSLVLMNNLKLKNLKLYILDNNEYSSTGGQKTCSRDVNFKSLAKNVKVFKIPKGKPDVGRIKLTPEQIKERFYNEINGM